MPKFDRASEKRRAKFAYNLYKFRDHLGRKLAQNEDGITKHKKAVAMYVAEFGPTRTNYEKVYQNIRRAIKHELQRQQDTAEMRQRLREAEYEEDKQRVENNNKMRIERQTERDRTNAKHIISTYPRRIAGLEKQLKDAQRRRTRFQETVDDLTPKLKTEAYQKLRGYRSMVIACEKSAYWVVKFTGIINRLESRLAPATIKLYEAKRTLGYKPQTNRTSVKWQPVWSKAKYDKYRELQNIPAKCDVRKVVLIWYGKQRQELRVFGVNPNCILKSLLGSKVVTADVRVKDLKFDMIDYIFNLKQYERASGR